MNSAVTKALRDTAEHPLKTGLSIAGNAKHLALNIAALGPYGEYYATYNAAKEINALGAKGGRVGSAISRVAAAPLVGPEARGLLGDVIIDLLKGESVRDEGGHGNINPLHSLKFVPSFMRRGRKVYLPGVEKHRVDFEW